MWPSCSLRFADCRASSTRFLFQLHEWFRRKQLSCRDTFCPWRETAQRLCLATEKLHSFFEDNMDVALRKHALPCAFVYSSASMTHMSLERLCGCLAQSRACNTVPWRVQLWSIPTLFMLVWVRSRRRRGRLHAKKNCAWSETHPLFGGWAPDLRRRGGLRGASRGA